MISPSHRSFRSNQFSGFNPVLSLEILLLSLVIAAFALRYPEIESPSLWFDEIITAMRAKMNTLHAIQNAREGGHAPIYFFLISNVANHYDPYSLRLPSVIAGSLAVAVLAAAAAAWAPKSLRIAATAATGVFACWSPYWIAYAQEARPYALTMLWLAATMLGLGLIVRSFSAREPSAFVRSLRDGLAIAVPSFLLAAWTSVAALLWLPLIVMVAIQIHRYARHFGIQAMPIWRGWAATLTLGIAALLLFLASALRASLESYWVPAVTVDEILRRLAAVWLAGIPDVVTGSTFAQGGWHSAVIAACMLCALAFLPRWHATILGGAVLVPVATILMVGFLGRPLFLPRYMVAAAVAAPLLAGLGFAYLLQRLTASCLSAKTRWRFWPKTVSVAVAGLLTTIALTNNGVAMAQHRKPDWLAAAEYVVQIIRPWDKLTFLGSQVDISITYALAKYGMAPAEIERAVSNREEPSRLIVVGGRASSAPAFAPPQPADVRWFGDIWVAVIERIIWADHPFLPTSPAHPEIVVSGHAELVHR